jgi:hypothetical protein
LLGKAVHVYETFILCVHVLGQVVDAEGRQTVELMDRKLEASDVDHLGFWLRVLGHYVGLNAELFLVTLCLNRRQGLARILLVVLVSQYSFKHCDKLRTIDFSLFILVDEILFDDVNFLSVQFLLCVGCTFKGIGKLLGADAKVLVFVCFVEQHGRIVIELCQLCLERFNDVFNADREDLVFDFCDESSVPVLLADVVLASFVEVLVHLHYFRLSYLVYELFAHFREI